VNLAFLSYLDTPLVEMSSLFRKVHKTEIVCFKGSNGSSSVSLSQEQVIPGNDRTQISGEDELLNSGNSTLSLKLGMKVCTVVT